MTATMVNRREAEIDTKLAELWGEEQALRHKQGGIRRSLHLALGLEERIGGRYGERHYPHSLGEIVRRAEEAQAEGLLDYYAEKAVARDLAEVASTTEALAKVRAEAAPLEAIFNEEQWSRFFLVTNTNGHIHSSMNCSTCYFDTSFAWLPQLSGLTEPDAVEEQGAILCSICFPSAPVEWTNGVSKATQAERDARAAEKAEREAAKAAKAITAPDGSPLQGKYGEIRTEVTARRELSGMLVNALYYGPEEYEHYARRLAEAIAHKTGEDVETLLTEARAKAKKRYDREMKEARPWQG